MKLHTTIYQHVLMNYQSKADTRAMTSKYTHHKTEDKHLSSFLAFGKGQSDITRQCL